MFKDLEQFAAHYLLHVLLSLETEIVAANNRARSKFYAAICSTIVEFSLYREDSEDVAEYHPCFNRGEHIHCT